MISLIVAIAQNNVIGGDNKLLWHISDDLKRFKKIPEDYQNKIKELSPAALEILATDIFELEKVEDLEKYF